MGLFSRDKGYDRTRLLDQAAKARKRGRLKAAVEAYQRVLQVEPRNADIHRKVAPLLARTRQHDAASHSYRAAAEELVRNGFDEQAIGVYREAAGLLPRRKEIWGALAELELRRGRKVDAVAALLAGRRHLRRRRDRADAIALLVAVRKIDPQHARAGVDLAGLLAKTGSRARALRLLDDLAARARGRDLRRVRGQQLWLAPGFGSAWRWVRAGLGGT
jgi:tetratricopeptide (TPR) repeat protein